MSDGVSFAVTLGCVVAAVLTLLAAARGRYRWSSTAPLVWALEVVLVLQAVAAVVGLVRGHRPVEPAVHVAYLVVSVLVLPTAAALVRSETTAESEEDRWSGLVVVTALVATAVVVVRMQTTWRS